MTRRELEIKAKGFDSKLKRHPMSSEELQKVLCDFVESLWKHDISEKNELLKSFTEYCDEEHGLFIPSWVIDGYNKSH